MRRDEMADQTSSGGAAPGDLPCIDGTNAGDSPCPETLRHHYEQVCENLRSIDDFRGKLLALWPILGAGAGGVALLIESDDPGALRLLAGFGFFVSVGLGVYEWHQSLRCLLLTRTARELECLLHLKVGTGQFLSVPEGFRFGREPPALQPLRKLITEEVQRYGGLEARDPRPAASSQRGEQAKPQNTRHAKRGRVARALDRARRYPWIRVGVASGIVYGSVVVGWIALFVHTFTR
jgi:hypothetical protein